MQLLGLKHVWKPKQQKCTNKYLNNSKTDAVKAVWVANLCVAIALLALQI